MTTDYGAAAEMFSAFLLVTLNEETAHAIGVPFSGLQDQIWSMIRLGVLVWMMYPVQSRWTLITDHLQKSLLQRHHGIPASRPRRQQCWCYECVIAPLASIYLIDPYPLELSAMIAWNILKLFEDLFGYDVYVCCSYTFYIFPLQFSVPSESCPPSPSTSVTSHQDFWFQLLLPQSFFLQALILGVGPGQPLLQVR